MTVSYYRCPIEGYGDVIVGVFTHCSFGAASVKEVSGETGTFDIQLCRRHDEDRGTVRIVPVELAEIPEDKHLSYVGHLIESGYPWGTQFIQAFDGLAFELDLETYHDPFKEGADSYGVLVGAREALHKVVPVMDARAEHLNENPDDWETFEKMDGQIYDACTEHGVIWLDTDWKHFEISLSDFDTVGVRAEYIEPSIVSQSDGLNIRKVRLLDSSRYETINISFSRGESN